MKQFTLISLLSLKEKNNAAIWAMSSKRAEGLIIKQPLTLNQDLNFIAGKKDLLLLVLHFTHKEPTNMRFFFLLFPFSQKRAWQLSK